MSTKAALIVLLLDEYWVVMSDMQSHLPVLSSYVLWKAYIA